MLTAIPRALISIIVLSVVLLAGGPIGALAGRTSSAWLLQAPGSGTELERDASIIGQLPPAVQVGAARYASQIFNGRRYNVGPGNEQADLQQQQEVDLFQCVEPTLYLFENFARQFNRTSGTETERRERLSLFATTLRRTIMLNRIIQNEILNQTNYELKPEIRNYHFISPAGQQNVPLWYADINDCELGLIKKIIFDIFYNLDRNDYQHAYKVALDNSAFLPLLSEEGFEQLANILLVRLYDRFKGDEKMNQLFQWPLYLKKLAGYAYNRRQVLQPDFNSRLALISYAYPAYFKDLKYNKRAVNRTGDNVKVHLEHEKFNSLLGRQFASRQERNKRLAVFRQHWTMVNLLNDDENPLNLTIAPDWVRAQQSPSQALDSFGSSARLTADNAAGDAESAQPLDTRFKYTQFSDLTDSEFVAFLTNDFSLLENSKESAEFIDANFPIRPLDDRFKGEIATELELRRTLQLQQQQSQVAAASGAGRAQLQPRPTLALAKQVVNELISDVGLPIGSVMMANISETEHFTMFKKLVSFFGKPYGAAPGSRSSGSERSARLGMLVGGAGPNESELADEQRRRYEQFKLNYGRFRAWFVKEGWQLDESQMLAMLRLADMSWADIKLTLFKVCCLAEENLAALAVHNASLQYFGSHEFMCRQLDGTTGDGLDADRLRPFATSGGATGDGSAGSEQQQQQARELAALELYYYYSVHFNKHHSDMEQFSRRFAIFKRNIDRIRWHSCTRGLTLYRSLKMKKFDTMSTIDVLDPRRSYTDDLHLDRYEYFSVPDLGSGGGGTGADADLGFERLRAQSPYDRRQESLSPSRAGISYRRDAFSTLYQRPELLAAPPRRLPGDSPYVEKLTSAAQNSDLHVQKYRRNRVHLIYDLVMQHYRHCMRTVLGIEVSGSERSQQQCQSSGPLGDQAAMGLGNLWDNQLGGLARQQQQQGQCAFYWQGLEPWAEGLIKQDLLSAQLIQSAKC